jgi:hypothetical protein
LTYPKALSSFWHLTSVAYVHEAWTPERARFRWISFSSTACRQPTGFGRGLLTEKRHDSPLA